jgi:hypothetical protein
MYGRVEIWKRRRLRKSLRRTFDLKQMSDKGMQESLKPQSNQRKYLP